MISRVRAWYGARGRGMKILLLASGFVAGLVLLYVVPRTFQYAAASRTPAGLFVPEGADVVVRVSDLAGQWRAVQQTEFWKTFTRRLLKDAAIRTSVNDILTASGAPTLDQLEDKRWLERNTLLQESSILKYAGRDFVLSTSGGKFCMATRVGLTEYLLLPALHVFPGAAGAQRVKESWGTVLKRGDLFISVQGAIVVASNDSSMLSSALQRRGPDEKFAGLMRATLRPEPLLPILRGFPLGALLTATDLETCKRLDIDVVLDRANLILRTQANGLQPRKAEPAPVDIARMIPENGLGACFTNVGTGTFWEWWQQVGNRRVRGGSPLDQFARDAFREFVEVLQNQGFSEDVVPKLDGPVSVLFGASRGDDDKTYAAIALYLRSSNPREAAEGLEAVIDRATKSIQEKGFKSMTGDAGGVPYRSYYFQPDPLHANNYLAVSYAVTGDALILANNRVFLEDALLCRANEKPPMAVQLHYEQAMRRLQELGMKKVMGVGAVESFFLYGPAIRQGLEGFYGTLASKLEDTPFARPRLRQDLQTAASKEGRPLTMDQLDMKVKDVMDERIREAEARLRGRARIFDYLKWIAFQAETANDGMKLEFALELKDR